MDLELDGTGNQFIQGGTYQGGVRKSYRQLDDLIAAIREAPVVVGHNILAHDWPFLAGKKSWAAQADTLVMDTLLLSTWLFPEVHSHKLAKDYLVDTKGLPDAVFDATDTAVLLARIVNRWKELETGLQRLLKGLLQDTVEFRAFFLHFAPQLAVAPDLDADLQDYLQDKACRKAPLARLRGEDAIALAYTLTSIQQTDGQLHTPSWALSIFPRIWEWMQLLRTTPCGESGCRWCRSKLDPYKGLKEIFGFEKFRTFEGDAPGELPLQERAVRAAVAGESLLVIFPTGGGKSLTFQLPALIRARFTGALTVVISPLVALMKDQVDGLLAHKVVNAATLNSLLNDIERKDVIEKIERGVVHILYLSPESLRSNTVQRLLMGRMIDRFVIDEAHCFSSWGQDFRVDYQYIGTFIAELQRLKRMQHPIPISCFTATARPEVVVDIEHYFQEKLQVSLQRFTTEQKRTNLTYEAILAQEGDGRNRQVLDLLRTRKGPAIVYVVRTRHAENVADYLTKQGQPALFFHGKMEAEEKKVALDRFKTEEDAVMVATSAFGMGVDKDDVRMVIHHTISNSLENYLQEAGRGGRNAKLDARCIVLYDKEDLNGHFTMLKQTMLLKPDIDKIWKAIKEFKHLRIVKSPLELAKAAGWDPDTSDLETKVKAAVNALEMANYVERKQNAPIVKPSSLGPRSLEKARAVLDRNTAAFSPEHFELAHRILGYVYGKDEVRIDYMAERLGISAEVIDDLLATLSTIGILLDGLDITVELKDKMSEVLKDSRLLEKAVLGHLQAQTVGAPFLLNLIDLQAQLEHDKLDCKPASLQNLLRIWEWEGHIRRQRVDGSSQLLQVTLKRAVSELMVEAEALHAVASQVISALPKLLAATASTANSGDAKAERNVFSLATNDLKADVEQALFAAQLPIQRYHKALLYLHWIGAIQLREGFLIYKSRLTIERKHEGNRKMYVKGDYDKLKEHYDQRTEQIHIVGAYAERLMQAKVLAAGFVADYFSLGLKEFVGKHFPGRGEELKRRMTPEKFKQIFGDLSEEQMVVVKDDESPNILIAAGPGSGKTRVLVRKMAALFTLEDNRAEQFLMLAFSRPAVNEFRSRLRDLLPKLVRRMDFFTFHGFAFQLLGQHGNLAKSDEVISLAIRAIEEGLVATDRVVGRTVLMVDEFQDLSKTEWRLLELILEKAESCKLIVVGDDDQAILGFRGGSKDYMRAVQERDKAKTYFLTTNFRSARRIVDISNQFMALFPDKAQRIKAAQPLTARQDALDGEVGLHKYQGGYLLPAAIQTIIKLLKGRPKEHVSVLCKTNEEVLKIALQLNLAGILAKPLVTVSGFQLRNLAELVEFERSLARTGKDGLVSEGDWNKGVAQIQQKFQGSDDLESALKAIDDFFDHRQGELIYLSDWQGYIAQLSFEDVFRINNQAIYVSTIHKAKGREFDQVHLVLDTDFPPKDEFWNVLYVGLTRARHALHIHTRNHVFDQLAWRTEERFVQAGLTEPLAEIELACSMKDVNLGNFLDSRMSKAVVACRAGQDLGLNGNFGFVLGDGSQVGYSTSFKETLEEWRKKDYTIVKAVVAHVVYWLPKDSNERVPVVIPRLRLKRLEQPVNR